jgi:hypothetical protein
MKWQEAEICLRRTIINWTLGEMRLDWSNQEECEARSCSMHAGCWWESVGKPIGRWELLLRRIADRKTGVVRAGTGTSGRSLQKQRYFHDTLVSSTAAYEEGLRSMKWFSCWQGSAKWVLSRRFAECSTRTEPITAYHFLSELPNVVLYSEGTGIRSRFKIDHFH